jgi:hypothetical protein
VLVLGREVVKGRVGPEVLALHLVLDVGRALALHPRVAVVVVVAA